MNTSPELNYEYVVIGAGSGGLVAAIGLAKLGYKTLLIEKDKIGGDCTHYGCVPSKALLHAALKVTQTGVGFEKAINSSNLTSPSEKRDTIQAFYEAEGINALQYARDIVGNFGKEETSQWLEKLGVDVIFGNAQFCSHNKLSIELRRDEIRNSTLMKSELIAHVAEIVISFDSCVIATGSRALIPTIDGLETLNFLTNRTIFDLQAAPKKLAIIGNGPIGIEMAQAFVRLGTHATIYGRSKHILKQSEPDLSDELQQVLRNEGVQFNSTPITKITHNHQTNQFVLDLNDTQETYDQLLVATGRKPNTQLSLDQAGVQFDSKGITINRQCKTSNARIFAIGDCCDVPRFTHMADHMGQVVVTNSAIKKYTKLPLSISSYKSPNLIPSVIFTLPELAQCGLTQEQAEQKYGATSVTALEFDISATDRNKTQNGAKQILKLITVGPFGRIVGVHILADRAGEILPEFQALISNKKRIFALGSLVRAYPTYTSRLNSIVLAWISKKYVSKR